jgi:copper ion binding protein
MDKVTFNVPGINCNHCVHTIMTEVGEMEGVKNVSADAEQKKVTVEYTDPATPEKIKTLLAEINYPVA